MRVVRRLRNRVFFFPPRFWLLVGGNFIYLVGYDLGYPFETIYLHGEFGLSMTTIGLILGLPLFAGLPMLIVGGAIADRVGRRWVLILGICGSATLFEGLALARSFWQLVACISFEAACGWAMFMTANNAIVGDLTEVRQRAEAFSFSRTAVNAGMVAGLLAGSLLLGAGVTFRELFAAGGGICVILLVVSLVWFKETRPDVPDGQEARLSAAAGYRVVLSDRRFLSFCAVTLLPLYGFGQLTTTFPVVLRSLLGISASSWGLLITLYALTGALFQYPVVKRMRGRDKMDLMAAASGLVAVGLGGAAFVPPGWPIVVLMPLVSLSAMLLIPVSSAIVSEMAPEALRGRYMGAWALVWTGGAALAPTFGGLAVDRLGARGAYAVVVAVGLLGSILFALQRGGPAVPAATSPSVGDQTMPQARAL